MRPFRLAEVTGQLCKFVDENIWPSGNESRSIAQSVGDSTSQYACAFAGLDIRVAIPNNEGMSGQDLKAVKHIMDQSRMGFFLRRTVTAQDGIELFLDTQTAQHGNG